MTDRQLKALADTMSVGHEQGGADETGSTLTVASRATPTTRRQSDERGPEQGARSGGDRWCTRSGCARTSARSRCSRASTWTSRPVQVMCLVGPSGSGKSTFLRCINHLETINAGRLYVDGELVGYEERGDKLHELQPRGGGPAAPRHRDGVPALQPVPAHDRAGEHHRGARRGSRASRRTQADRDRPRAAGAGRAGRQGDGPTRPSCPAGSSSGWRSPGRWPCSPS